jgi:hypothetical protein
MRLQLSKVLEVQSLEHEVLEIQVLKVLEVQDLKLQVLDIETLEVQVSNVHISDVKLLKVHVLNIQVHVTILKEIVVIYVLEDLVTNVNETIKVPRDPTTNNDKLK